mmetsp:Transcript_15429/g.47756  ORF Transcript_15429/g.47756 Transcript_15429/m.47756 type:complete len:172 (+) Transcript_15429:235-750(+)
MLPDSVSSAIMSHGSLSLWCLDAQSCVSQRLIMSQCECGSIGGDMRRAVMLFQSCVICYGSKGPITTDVLEGISGEIPSLLMKSLWISAKQKDFAAMSGIIVCIMLQGYSATCCLSNIHDAVLANTMIHDEGKAIIFEAIAAADKNVSDGANADLQLRAVCSCICERRPSQ